MRVHLLYKKVIKPSFVRFYKIDERDACIITNEIHVRIYREISWEKVPSEKTGSRVRTRHQEEKKRPIYEYRSHYLSLQKVNKNSHAAHRSCLLKYYRYFGEWWSERWRWWRWAGTKWQRKGGNDRGAGKEGEERKRGENARHVSGRRDVISKDQLQ